MPLHPPPNLQTLTWAYKTARGDRAREERAETPKIEKHGRITFGPTAEISANDLQKLNTMARAEIA